MRSRLPKFVSDYGMLIPFFLVCAFFAFFTQSDHFPTGEAAAHQVAKIIAAEPAAKRIMIATRDQSEDLVFAKTLTADLEKHGVEIVAAVKGEPRDARVALANLADRLQSLDVIACTPESAEWIVFADLAADYPALGSVRVVSPTSYRWPSFLKADNLLNIANQIAVIAILAIGMTMVVITGGIDLSVGSLIALSAVLATYFVRQAFGGVQATASGMAAACVLAVLVCGAVGILNGALITLFEVPPFIVTLAMMLIASGAAYLVSGGESIYQLPETFVWLGRGASAFGIPNAVLLMLILYVVAHVVMSRMRIGRYLYSVGGNREAARLSGVPVRRITVIAYVVSALLAGLGGIIFASQFRSGSPTFGLMYELYVIAAVVVGGASLSGGEGKMFGTLIGAFTIAVINNGMNLTQVEPYTQKVVLGLVILGAVLLDKLRRRF
jgi:ribose transport system permease protein